MNKIVFKTEYGSLTLRPDGKIVLEFPPLYFNSDVKKYRELVNFFNKIIENRYTGEENISKNSEKSDTYQLMISFFSEEQKQNFLRLLNYPILFSTNSSENLLKSNFNLFDNIDDNEENYKSNQELLDVCLN